MYDDILLPTDGGTGMAETARHAGMLAQCHGSTVHVMSIADTRNRFESPSSGIAPDAWKKSETDRAEKAVDDVVNALPEEVEVERIIESGVPHKKILERSRDPDMDVIVMKTYGRTGLNRYLIGSVAERVVRKSSTPVLTVRVKKEGED